MLTWIMIVVLLVVITVIATVLIGRNGDANYSKATKGNIKRLTMIYIISRRFNCWIRGVHLF